MKILQPVNTITAENVDDVEEFESFVTSLGGEVQRPEAGYVTATIDGETIYLISGDWLVRYREGEHEALSTKKFQRRFLVTATV